MEAGAVGLTADGSSPLRKQGGQPSGDGKTRGPAAPEPVDERFEHLPASCDCGHLFDGRNER